MSQTTRPRASPLRTLHDNFESGQFRRLGFVKMLFEEGLRRAEQDGQTIQFPYASINASLLADCPTDMPLAMGKMAAYAPGGQRLGRQVEWHDKESGQRWVFLVPDEYRREKGVLFVDHPFWVLEEDGNSRLVHPEPSRVALVKNFPCTSGVYWEEYPSFPRIGARLDADAVKEFYKRQGHYKKVEPNGYTHMVYRHVVELTMTESRVGPVLLEGNPKHTWSYRVRMDWTPNLLCSLLVDTEDSIAVTLALAKIAANSPVKRLRTLPKVEIANVIVQPQGKTIALPAGTGLWRLGGSETVEFSCMQASCGICEFRVLHGAENLDPPNENEREYLSFSDTPKGTRLACQARIRRGTVEITQEPEE